jgi:hypothetical protein
MVSIIDQLRDTREGVLSDEYQYSDWSRCLAGQTFLAATGERLSSGDNTGERRRQEATHPEFVALADRIIAASGMSDRRELRFQALSDIADAAVSREAIAEIIDTAMTADDERWLTRVEKGEIKSKILVGGGSALAIMIAVVSAVTLL